MKKRFIWLVLSVSMTLSLILASCAPAAPVAPTTPTVTTPTTPTAPTTPKPTTPAPTTPGAEMVKDSLGRLVEKPKYGGTFTYAWSAPPGGLDNAFEGRSSLWILSLTHEEMLKADWLKGPSGTGETEFIFPTVKEFETWTGSLAERWETPDDTTIIYHIRKGVHWALNPASEASRLVGGREFTASDVAFTFTRMYNLDGKTPTTYFYARMTPPEFPVSVTTPDKYTVVVKINKGYMSSVLESLSDFFFIYAPEPVAKFGDYRDWKNNVGTGPYILVDHIQGSSSTFIRNPNYWGKDPLHPENQLPYPDGVKMLVITDRSTRMAAFRTAKIDNLGVGRDGVTWDESVSVRKTIPPVVRELEYPQYDATVLTMRTDKPEQPWYNLKVRQAIAMGIDRATILKEYFGGHGLIKMLPIPPLKGWMDMYVSVEQLPGAARELYEYHPDKAKQLLAEAGYPNGFKMQVLTLQKNVDLLSVIKAQLAKIGVQIEIDTRETTVYSSITGGRTHKEAVFQTMGVRTPFNMQFWLATDSSNLAMVNDPYVNGIREQVKGIYVTDEPKARQLIKEFSIYLVNQSWNIEMPSTYYYAFWWPWVKGYNGEMVPGYTNDFVWTQYLWIDQTLKKSMGF
ncbi:MAG: ABC transporter substrate-binding protein [Chloroflexi bacterium]|nr:ABC transporter substrate-binding protein [Chloroflexota bacterium]